MFKIRIIVNHNLEVGAGIVDASNFCVILNNLSTRDYYVAAGDVIAELKLGKENLFTVQYI